MPFFEVISEGQKDLEGIGKFLKMKYLIIFPAI
jgi:hypothetical protein